MSLSEALYLTIIGTVSGVAVWIIISAFTYIYKKIKTLYSDIKQMKNDMDELKLKVKNFEDGEKK
jgi:cell division protein FtsL